MTYREYLLSQPFTFYFWLTYFSVMVCSIFAAANKLEGAKQNAIFYALVIPLIVSTITFINFKEWQANDFQPVKYKLANPTWDDVVYLQP